MSQKKKKKQYEQPTRETNIYAAGYLRLQVIYESKKVAFLAAKVVPPAEE